MPSNWSNDNYSPRKQRLPANWAALRRAAFAMWGTHCYLCGHENVSDIDHVISGDNHSLENLRPICGARCVQCKAEQRTPCHLSKTGREAGRRGGVAAQARRDQLGRRRRPPEDHPGKIR